MVARKRIRTQQVVEEEPEFEHAGERGEVMEEVEAPAPRKSIPRVKLHTAARSVRPAQHAPEHAKPRSRRKKSLISEDIFFLPVDEIPEGSSYEWKRWTVMGEQNPFYIAQMREQGWEPVDPKRHPNWVPPGYNEPYIIKGGQILMERPEELTKEARAEARTLAKRQVREAEQRLGMTPKGELTREHPGLKIGVQKEIGRMVAIEE
jgi:hypothetical protein